MCGEFNLLIFIIPNSCCCATIYDQLGAGSSLEQAIVSFSLEYYVRRRSYETSYDQDEASLLDSYLSDHG